MLREKRLVQLILAMGLAATAAGKDGLDLSKYSGKVVLLNFWATTCGGCKLEIPWFMEFQVRYKSRGLVVIGVSMDDDGWKSVKPYVKQKKINYPVVIGTEGVAKQYGGVEALPMTLLIDRAGKIAASYTGVVDKQACESEIVALLR
jgi:cytochrome c biogenesis protein CcmG/thiol:disulfide interchange protein DsbE